MSNDFADLFGDWPPEPNPNQGRANPDHAHEPENRVRRPIQVRECKVVNVFEATYADGNQDSTNAKTNFVLLRDSIGRDIRIFVLPDVAYAMCLALSEHTPERPFTHDLMKNILVRMGATIECVTVDDLWQDTFYSKITIVKGDESLEIDSRPSDAIALALRFNAPIYISEHVLEAAQHE